MTPGSPFLRAAAAVMLTTGVAAACPTPAKLTASDAQPSDFMGQAMSLSPTASGVSLMVGVPDDNTAGGSDAGSVYTYTRVNGIWGQVGHFYASDAAAADFFGASVGYSDPYAVVGAPGAVNSGAAYFFERAGSSWVQKTKVTPASGSESGADAGRSVAISGTTALVGAPLKDGGIGGQVGNAGWVYVYNRAVDGTWVFDQAWYEENSSDVEAGDNLGYALAISGNLAVVGVPGGQNINYPDDHGYIRVYRRTLGQWAYQTRLFSNNAEQGDRYGSAVATDGTFIAIGVQNDDMTAAQGGPHTNSGCVYIQHFRDGDWHIDGQLFAPDAADNAYFGTSVSIKNGRLVVGAQGSKKAYIFRRAADAPFSWVCDAVLTDPDEPAGGNFGYEVATDGSFVIVGDYGDDRPNLTNAGAVYAWQSPAAGQSDTCEGAIPVLSGTHTGCTSIASRGIGSVCGNGGISGPGPDVWYAWTAPCSGQAMMHTFDSEYNTVLSVHSGCPQVALTRTIVCNDDAGGIWGDRSLVQFDAEAGVTYYVRVGGYNGASGDFTLTIFDPGPPNHDNCAYALPVTNGTYTASTCAATDGGPINQSCGQAALPVGEDLWYRYTASCQGVVRVSLCGSDFDTALQIFAGGSCPTQLHQAMACNDDSGLCAGQQSALGFPASPGDVFMIRVGGIGGSTGEVVLTIACQSPCDADWNGDNTVNSTDISSYLTSWLQSVSGQNLSADFNSDGSVNSTDISVFLTAWLQAVQGGC